MLKLTDLPEGEVRDSYELARNVALKHIVIQRLVTEGVVLHTIEEVDDGYLVEGNHGKDMDLRFFREFIPFREYMTYAVSHVNKN